MELNNIINEQPMETEAISTQTASSIQWFDSKAMSMAYRTANLLAKSDLLPDTYKGRPENVLIMLDTAARMNMSPILVAQNLYIVKGKPAWSGSFCVAAINGCGKFTPLEFVFVENGGGGCFAQATRLADGKLCRSDTITMQMAKDEGWLDKNGSKWKTFPRQMMMYRSASFFARVYCPEVLLGIQTADEVRDVHGVETAENEKIIVTLDGVVVNEEENNG